MLLFTGSIGGLHYALINMKGTFIIHLRADEKCTGEKKEALQGQLHIGYPGDEWVERKGGKKI